MLNNTWERFGGRFCRWGALNVLEFGTSAAFKAVFDLNVRDFGTLGAHGRMAGGGRDGPERMGGGKMGEGPFPTTERRTALPPQASDRRSFLPKSPVFDSVQRRGRPFLPKSGVFGGVRRRGGAEMPDQGRA